MSLFSGKSPEKTMIRAIAYSSVKRPLFYSGYHIVIASRECADIKFLLEHGVDKRKIIACDIDHVARFRAGRLGVIVSPYCDIADTVLWASRTYRRKNIASVNVDLCMMLETGIPILKRVLAAQATSKKTPIFFVYRRAREHGKMRRFPNNQTRLDWLKVQCDLKDYVGYDYTSWHKDCKGSQMTMVVL